MEAGMHWHKLAVEVVFKRFYNIFKDKPSFGHFGSLVGKEPSADLQAEQNNIIMERFYKFTYFEKHLNE